MLTKETQEKRFKEIYENLNEKQQQAVNELEGPVMVIAGPGTGKTQILSARIGNILLKSDAKAENILCLTYTDAGAIAMRRRLQDFIGPEAYKVTISTFHAFCNDVIQDNLYAFQKNDLDPVSDLERIQIMRKLIDNFDANHPLKRFKGEIYYDIKPLSALFTSMKREGWSAKFLNDKIDEYLEEIKTDNPDSPYYQKFRYKRKSGNNQKGDLNVKYKETVDKIAKTKAAVNEFENYQKLMSQAGVYDFEDMINWVIEAFEENEELLRRYQEQFLYILIDEFQDTSGTQNKIVELLINFWDKPNVFVVGDDDQSIFRFQGANIENMNDFASMFEAQIKTIMLVNNYRSSQPILDASMSVIANNNDRLVNKMKGLSKDLIASHELKKNVNIIPKIVEYPSQNQEMIAITEKIFNLIKNGVAPGNIGVLYKENRYGEDLATYFRLKKIPFYIKRSEDLFTLPFAEKIINLLRYINLEMDAPYGGDGLLFEILHYDWFKIPAIEIAKLSVEVNNKKYKEPTSLRKEIFEKSNPATQLLFDNEQNLLFKKASDAIEKLLEDLPNVTLLQLIENLVNYTGLINYIMQSPYKIRLLKILTAFFDFVKATAHRNPKMNLKEFILTIDTMEKENIPIPLIEVSGNETSVNLLTAHGSKGLEFEYVFIASTYSKAWEKKSVRKSNYLLPENIFDTNEVEDAEKGKALEELRRLFYVAMTRAEKTLEISFPSKTNDGKDLEPSIFISEVMEFDKINKIEKEYISEELIADYQALYFLQDKSPEIAQMENDFIQPLLDKFVMNVTALNNYLDCQLKFYFNNLVRIPAVKNESMEFGSAVHFALQKLFEKMKNNQNVFPPVEFFMSSFKWYIDKNRENFTQESYDRAIQFGEKILPDYYHENINTWNKIVSVERNIKNVQVKNVPIKGKLDKIEFDGNNVNIVDYKTGKFENAKKKLNAPKPEKDDLIGGDYWRQAVFYKILIDNDGSNNWRAVSTQFDFVEPIEKGKYESVKIVISPADVESVTEQITDSWQKIQNKEFTKGCGKPDCEYCNFVKDNNLYVALHTLNDGEDE